MQKRLLLSLFLSSSFGVYAMEEEYQCSFRALQPFWPRCLVNDKILTPFQEAQESKNKFANQLQISIFSGDYWFSTINQLFSPSRIHANPIEFLKYCYHQKLHGADSYFFIDLSDLDQDVSLLNMCKDTCINGYSAVGAAIIGENRWPRMEIVYKAPFIRQLLKKGFRFTEKDRMLVALHLYDVIPAEQKQMMVSLLHGHMESDLAKFPHDMRRCIVDYIVHLHKKSDWLWLLLNRFA